MKQTKVFKFLKKNCPDGCCYNMYTYKYVYIYMYLYRQESNLAVSSSPVTNNNVPLLFRRTATMWKNFKKISSSAPVWAWWPFASVMLAVRFQSRD
jgi:hypothetical protein